jgi:hypothetical protein
MLHYAPRSAVSSALHRTRVKTTSLLQKLLLRQARVPHTKHTFPLIVVTVKIMQISHIIELFGKKSRQTAMWKTEE